MASTKKKWLVGWRANVLVMAVAFVTCFGLGEIVARVLFSSSVGQELGTAGPNVLDAERGWKVNPSYRFSGQRQSADGSTYPVKISFAHDGFRQFGNLDSKRKKVLVLGDSLTEAIQVSDDRTYYYLAGKQLNWEVFAYGCSGYQTLQEYQVLDRYFDVIKPNLVIWQFCFNDFVDNDVDLEAHSTRNNNGLTRPYWVNGRIVYLLPKPGLERILRRTLGWSRLMGFAFNRVDKLRSTDPNGSIETVLARVGFADPGFARSLKVTDEILGMVRQRVGSTPVDGLYVGGMRPREDAPASEAFQSLCRKYGFTFLSSSDALAPAESKGVVARYSDKAHWNETGHRLVSEFIIKSETFGSSLP